MGDFHIYEDMRPYEFISSIIPNTNVNSTTTATNTNLTNP